MKPHKSIAAATVVVLFSALSVSATNSISVAGVEMPVRFPDTGLDDARKAFILQDAVRYFTQTSQLRFSGETETNLVAIRSATMVARNQDFENGFRFVVDAGKTNMVVSETLASLYAGLLDWPFRTNLLAKADEFLTRLGPAPLPASASERRSLFRHFENGTFRPPSVDEASDEDVAQTLSEIRERFGFTGSCMLELEYSEEFVRWTLPLRFVFQAGTNDFEKAVLSTPAVFVDESWRLIY